MRSVTISNNLLDKHKKTTLGVLHYRANVMISSTELENKFDNAVSVLKEKYSLQSITDNRHINSTREAYMIFGKKPNRYRNAAEAMLRRIVNGTGLYRINNIVDINNIISVSSGYSIGSYSAQQLKGDIVLKLADKGEKYPGIGKQSVNIEFLPTLYDDYGAFGNPTSDSQRAMVKECEKDIISVIYSFDDDDDLEDLMVQFASMLKQYAGVSEVETWTV